MTPPSPVEISPVQSRSDLRTFIDIPFRLYRNDPCWVPPLRVDRLAFFDRQKNPFYQTAETCLFIARRDDRPVGRIAACVNADYNEFHEDRTGSYGFFEAPHDAEVAGALFDAAAGWVRARGMQRLLGPFNFSTNHEVGCLIEGFDSPPTVMMTYNPSYHRELAEGWGLVKAKDLLAFRMEKSRPPADRIRRIADRVRERNRVRIRSIEMQDFASEIDRVRRIYNEAWSRNWGFVPLREEEFRHIARDMKFILDPRVALIAEIEDRPVGFCLGLPNIYEAQIKVKSGRLLPTGLARLLWALKIRKSIRSVRVITMGVIPEYRLRGIESVFYIETYDRGTAAGYDAAEISWVLEDNDLMVKAAEALGSVRYKTYRIFEKNLL